LSVGLDRRGDKVGILAQRQSGESESLCVEGVPIRVGVLE
jgi:hypothetical protein